MTTSPPKIAEKLLRKLFPDTRGHTMLGDFEEEFHYLTNEKGVLPAIFWYWLQLFTSIISMIFGTIYWGFIMLKNYLLIAFRVLRKHTAYSLINIFGLTLGLTCSIFIFLFIAEELSYDTFFTDSDRIYRIVRQMPDVHGPSTRNPLGPAMQAGFPELSKVTRYWQHQTPTLVAYNDLWFKEEGIAFAGPQFLEIFDYRLISGNRETVFSENNNLVITASAALKYFGDEDPVGKTMMVETKFPYLVSGVMEDVPGNSHLQFDFLMPIESYNRIAAHFYGYNPSEYSLADDWMAGMFGTYIKLIPQAQPEELEAKFPDFLKQFASYNPEVLDETLYLQPIKEIRLYSDYTSGGTVKNLIYLIYGLIVVGIIIISLASFNYMNMATAQYITRTKEVGMRKVIGARRIQLIVQFFCESAVFSVIAMVISLLLVGVLMPYFNQSVGKSLDMSFLTDPIIIAGIIGITLLTAVTSGSYPALFLSRFRPAAIISGKISLITKRGLFRNSLVLVQFTATIIFFICAVVINDQINFMKDKDLGITKDNILILPVKEDAIRNNYETVKNELLQIPDVSMVSFSAKLPINLYGSTTTEIESNGERKVFELTFANVDYDFLDLYEIEMAAGRKFSRDFTSDGTNSIIINETTAEILGYENPIGQTIEKFGGSTIVGVAKNFHFQPVYNEIRPLAFFLYRRNFRFASVKFNTTDTGRMLSEVEKVWEKHAPDGLFEYYFLNDEFQRLYKTQEKVSSSIGYLSAFALCIALLGLFGLSSFTVNQKSKTISIRKVFGASFSEVFMYITRDYFVLIVIANILAWPVAWYLMAKLVLIEFAYRTELGISVFLITGVLSLIVAAIVVAYYSVKAALTNPADTLRQE